MRVPVRKEGEGGLTLYGAYHLARRVLPLVHVSHIDLLQRHCMRSVCQWDALPVLDQDEREHHLCDCMLSRIRYVKLLGG